MLPSASDAIDSGSAGDGAGGRPIVSVASRSVAALSFDVVRTRAEALQGSPTGEQCRVAAELLSCLNATADLCGSGGADDERGIQRLRLMRRLLEDARAGVCEVTDGDRARDEAIGLLGSHAPRVREAGVFALGAIETPAIVELLVSRIETDPDVGVRQEAVSSLAGMCLPEARRATEAQIEGQTDARVRQYARRTKEMLDRLHWCVSDGSSSSPRRDSEARDASLPKAFEPSMSKRCTD